jgi:guanine nucleotide-binding protein alpha-1 subunit
MISRASACLGEVHIPTSLRPVVILCNRAFPIAVVFYNVVCSVRNILATLEGWEDVVPATWSRSPDPDTNSLADNVSETGPLDDPSTPESPTQQPKSVEASQIASLRLRLSPLLAVEAKLAEHLSGGVQVAGSLKGNALVRSGWQAREIENGQKIGRPRTGSASKSDGDKAQTADDPFLQEVRTLLEKSKADIQTLWEHPTVKAFIASRRLRLEAWATLCVLSVSHSPWLLVTPIK